MMSAALVGVLLSLGLTVPTAGQDDFVQRAREAKQAGDVDKAIRILEQGLPDDPDSASAHYVLGWLYVGKGEEASAAADLAQRELSGSVLVCESGKEAAGHIILRGEDLQSSIHLVDYLLDLAHAPLNGRTPIEVMSNVFEQEWPGTPFLAELGQTPDPDIHIPRFERPPCPHVDDMAEWTDKAHWMVWPNTQGDANLSGPLPVIWNFILLQLPLPDGTRIDLAAL